jgi:hypothetical protein
MNPASKEGEPALPSSYLFTLRFWVERGAEGEGWRGRLESVSSGEVRHCRDWQQLVSYLREMLESTTLGSGA